MKGKIATCQDISDLDLEEILSTKKWLTINSE